MGVATALSLTTMANIGRGRALLPQTPARPWYKSCGTKASGSALKHGAIDAIGVAVAEAGVILGALTANLNNGAGTGVTAGSTITTVATMAYPEAKALPIVGNFVSAGGFVYDGYSAYEQYKTCKAGGG